MIPTWFFDKQIKKERKEGIVKILNNFVINDISNIIVIYSESDLDMYSAIELEFYSHTGELIPKSARLYILFIIQLTKKIYLRLNTDRLINNAEVWAECYDANSGVYKTKCGTWIGQVINDKFNDDYTYQVEYKNKDIYRITKDEYEEYQNNCDLLLDICI